MLCAALAKYGMINNINKVRRCPCFTADDGITVLMFHLVLLATCRLTLCLDHENTVGRQNDKLK